MRLASFAVTPHAPAMPPAAPPRVGFGLRELNLVLSVVLCAPGPAARAQMPVDPTFPRTSGDRGSFSDGAPRVIERLPVFFPPNPPPLGRSVARGVPGAGRYQAPAELAHYVSEFFYPALGTRLATRNFNDKLRGQLEAYRAAKLALQAELRSGIDELRGAEPAVRLEGLVMLSRRQTPKIIELEKTAEQLRRTFITSENNWSAVRQWHLSDKHRRGFSPIEIAQVMRAHAYYDHHLLPAQRRLLREIAIELVFAAENTAAATAAQPFLFFPPEPARVLLPEDMPPEVAARVAAYQTKKSRLKKELYDAVHDSDGASFAFLRGSSLRTLAEKQGTRLVELETLAEEIRRGLAALPPPPAPRSPVPTQLDARVSDLVTAYQSAQAETVKKIEEILTAAKNLPMQANYRFEGETLKFLVVPTRGARGGGANSALPRIEAVRAQVSAVADDYGRRVADLLNERESIRQAIAESLNLTQPDEIDRALISALRVANQRYADTAFSEYRVAVFEPGLSPEQRRLLFDAVVEGLELPLPRGDLQPAARAETW